MGGIAVMREIKFRTWNRRRKRMSEVACIKFGEPITYDFVTVRMTRYGHPIYEDGYLGEDNNYTLMQYIGAKDKNGTEIYEGDIVRSPDGKDYVIRWSDLTYRFVADSIPANRVNPQLVNRTIGNYEVVGNIYENLDEVEAKEKSARAAATALSAKKVVSP